MKPRIQIEHIPVASLAIPDGEAFNRVSYNTREDKQLAEAIKKNRNIITQPLVVVKDGERYMIVKGTRRYHIAKTLGIPKVRCVVKEVPAGRNKGEYMEKLRLVLDTHRQDLSPLQRAELVQQIKNEWGFSNKDVAKYLSVTTDTITNWTAILEYAPEIQQAINEGTITMHAARIFVGMTLKGQRHVLEKHMAELTGGEAKGELHKRLRKLYHPDSHPGFYVDAADASRRLKVKQSATRRAPKPKYAFEQRATLLDRVETKDSEVTEYKEKDKNLDALFIVTAPLAASALRDKRRRAIIERKWPTMIMELEAFLAKFPA